MIARVILASAGLLAAMPAVGAELKAEEARRFVVGKLFAFSCFDGTSGAGRIQADGSAAGIIRFGGTGSIRSVALPAGTIRVQGESVCASLKGTFSPCFYLEKTSQNSFRGSIVGLRFAYCHFIRRGGRIHPTRATTAVSPRPSRSTAGVKDDTRRPRSAAAAEKPVQLKQAPGLDKVEANCGACHSLDYLIMNSQFLNASGWDAEVAKMINAFGAPIDRSDAEIIADYLKTNYGM